MIADDTSMAVDACARFCFYSGFAFAGVEYASECYFGTALQTACVAVAEGDCAMACSGDATN